VADRVAELLFEAKVAFTTPSMLYRIEFFFTAKEARFFLSLVVAAPYPARLLIDNTPLGNSVIRTEVEILLFRVGHDLDATEPLIFHVPVKFFDAFDLAL
jgi:hypothetical protein